MNRNPTYRRPKWLEKLDPKFNTLSFHLQHPEIDPDIYIRSQHVALGDMVLKKRRIYLDQKYWIYCRDVIRGKPQHPLHPEIYKLLSNAVKAGEAVCPASHLVLEETLKQEDSESRYLTATVVQELSTGISLQAYPVLSQAEILHFLITTRPYPVNAYPCEQLAWTHIGNVFGHISPISTGFDANTEKAIRKSWFDLMGGIQLPTLTESLYPLPPEISGLYSNRYYDEQNQQCRKHANDFSSFTDVFLVEISGALDVFQDELAEAQKYLFQKHLGQKDIIVPEAQLAEGTRQLSNLIYHAFRLDKIRGQLPGLRIMAGLHAAIRYKHQKHGKGDRHDHLHARVALPYCNLFLTEKTLGHLLCDRPLEYDKLYGCRVVWDPVQVLDALTDILKPI